MASINPIVQFYPYTAKAGIRPKLDSLPFDAIKIIFNFLSPDDLLKACQLLNRRLSSITDKVLQSKVKDYISSSVKKIKNLELTCTAQVLLEIDRLSYQKKIEESWQHYYENVQKDFISVLCKLNMYILVELRKEGFQEKEAFPRLMNVSLPVVAHAQFVALNYLNGRVFLFSRPTTFGLIPTCAALLNTFKRSVEYDKITNETLALQAFTHLQEEPLTFYDSSTRDHSAAEQDLLKLLIRKNLFLPALAHVMEKRKNMKRFCVNRQVTIHITNLLGFLKKINMHFSSFDDVEIQGLAKILDKIRAIINDNEQHPSKILNDLYQDIFSVQLKIMQLTPLLK